MTQQALSSKDFAVADVFENGADSLVGSKEENAKLIAQSQKSGPAAKLASAALVEKFPEPVMQVEAPLKYFDKQSQMSVQGRLVNGRSRSERQ